MKAIHTAGLTLLMFLPTAKAEGLLPAKHPGVDRT